ncbi:MAG: AraC family transcriptional regulator [Cyanobium sp.]
MELYPLPMQNLSHDSVHDSDMFAAKMSRTANVETFYGLVPPQYCRHRIGHLRINDVNLLSYTGTDARFTVKDCQNAQFVLGIHGFRRAVTPLGETGSRPGEAMLLPPGDRELTGTFSGVIITLSPQSIQRVAAVMAGESIGRVERRLQLDRFSPCLLPCGPQAKMLHSLIQFIDQCLPTNPLVVSRFALDDQICRFAALMLDPGLLQREPGDQMRIHAIQGKVAFDDLIDYIKANLDKSLRLSDLEARSRYSRRALQYAFRKQLNCTPIQYIRAQRLDAAMQRIKASGGTCSIRDIAMQCGYTNPRLFTADFKLHYGILPSDARWIQRRACSS